MPALEIQELVQSLSHTTARLSRVERESPQEIARALQERAHAIAAIANWIAATEDAAQAIGPDLGAELGQNLENGRQMLLRLALVRELTRADRMAVHRELQVLHGILDLCVKRRGSLNCCG